MAALSFSSNPDDIEMQKLFCGYHACVILFSMIGYVLGGGLGYEVTGMRLRVGCFQYAISIAGLLLAAAALTPACCDAQSISGSAAAPPPTHAVDRNNVDLITGQPLLDVPTLSSAGIARKAAHFRESYYDDFTSYLPGQPSVGNGLTPFDNSPVIGGRRAIIGSDIFYICDSSNNCNYIDREGSRYIFDSSKSSDGGYANKPSIAAMVSQIIKADGETLNIYYATAYQPFPPVCTGPQGPCQFDSSTQFHNRSVVSSNGWMIKYDLTRNSQNQLGTIVDVLSANKIYIINTSVDYCDPNADSCTAADSALWPTFNVVPGAIQTAYTDVNNQPIGNYGTTLSITPSGIRRDFDLAGSRVNVSRLNGTPIATYTYNWQPLTTGSAPYIITATNPDGSAYSARSEGAFFQFNPPRLIMTTIDDPGGSDDGQQGGVIAIDTTPTFFYLQQMSSFTDELGRVTRYEYNDDNTAVLADNRTIKHVISPEATYNGATLTGGYTEYAYDGRRNVTSVSVYPKGGGIPLVSRYSFEANCTYLNYKYCNKVEAAIDPKGNETDYVYNPANGEISVETKPADANGVRPQTRYFYTQLTPQIKDANGNMVGSIPVWRLTNTSTCQSSINSCAGTSDETVTTYTYNTPNLLKTSVTVAAGNANVTQPYSNTNLWQTTSYAYDIVGNVIMVDGPRTDVDDRTYTTYDVRRRPVYEIGADPDGTGPLKRITTHHVYDNDNRDYRTETGTCGSITFTNGVPVDCADFAVTRYVQKTFDANGNLVQTTEATVP